MIRIMIADDHPIVRNGLRQIISEESDLQVSCEAANADQIFDQLKKVEIDVLILDLSMPGPDGLNVLNTLKNIRSKIPILILSGYSEQLYAKRVLKAGASGYMHKESAPDELIKAIRKVYNGGKYISSQLGEILATDLISGTSSKPHDKLSHREFQIFIHIGRGKKIGEISEEMNLGVNTISTYRKRIIEKTGLKNNSEIITYCINEKLI